VEKGGRGKPKTPICSKPEGRAEGDPGEEGEGRGKGDETSLSLRSKKKEKVDAKTLYELRGRGGKKRRGED